MFVKFIAVPCYNEEGDDMTHAMVFNAPPAIEELEDVADYGDGVTVYRLDVGCRPQPLAFYKTKRIIVKEDEGE